LQESGTAGRGRDGDLPAIRCANCLLRRSGLFRPMSGKELGAIARMKQRHLVFAPGDDILRCGDCGPTFYTLYEGWAVRYQRLRSGARQILDVLLPGDWFGLAPSLLGRPALPVQAVTRATCCMLDGRQLGRLFEDHPRYAIALLATQLEGERSAHARLTMLGRLRAEERVGYFLAGTLDRLQRRGLAEATGGPFPLRRADIADAVGLSKVHAMRALQALRLKGLAEIDRRELRVADPVRLAAHVGYEPMPETGRAIL